jgi:hypothetical protein
MSAAEGILYYYDQELNLAQQLCKITELIARLIQDRKASRIPRFLSQRQSVMDQFRALENRSFSLRRRVFAQWDILSLKDRAAIQSLLDRIAENLGAVTVAEKKIHRLLVAEHKVVREELQRVSSARGLLKKYRPDQEQDPRYFSLSA